MKAFIRAHREEPLNVDLADGKNIKLQANESVEADLNGAEIGYVEAKLEAQARDRLIRGTGGGVDAPERAKSDANPPPKSKKALLKLEAERYGIKPEGLDYGELQVRLKAQVAAGVEPKPVKPSN